MRDVAAQIVDHDGDGRPVLARRQPGQGLAQLGRRIGRGNARLRRLAGQEERGEPGKPRRDTVRAKHQGAGEDQPEGAVGNVQNPPPGGAGLFVESGGGGA